MDSTDKGTPGTTCTGTVSGACRIVDLDFDGDYDATDATLFDDLTQGLARHPDRTTSAVNFPFGHQGLYYDAELESYQNRHRQYNPVQKRFMQRDPVVYEIRRRTPDLHEMLWAPGTSCMGGSCVQRTVVGDLAVLYPQGQYSDGMGLYAYARNAPLVMSDPSGRYCCDQRPCTGGPAGAPPPVACNAGTLGATGDSGRSASAPAAAEPLVVLAHLAGWALKTALTA